MQVVEGADGAKAVHDSWPAFHKSTVHASPLLSDFDFDGILDILVATYDGEIRVFKDTVRWEPALCEVQPSRMAGYCASALSVLRTRCWIQGSSCIADALSCWAGQSLGPCMTHSARPPKHGMDPGCTHGVASSPDPAPCRARAHKPVCTLNSSTFQMRE